MKKLIFRMLLITVSCAVLTGCQKDEKVKEKKQLTLTIKTPPISLGNIPGTGEAESFDLFTAASEKFKDTYEKYDVDFKISRYNYVDEKEQLEDKYKTKEAADIIYSGSYNIPAYAAKGWLVPMEDMIDDELRGDIEDVVWEQNSVDGKVYTIPFQQLQNTLMVNRTMMEEAGLSEYIPEKDTIAKWSTEEFNTVLGRLKESLAGSNKFAFMMYAGNSQGDNHIMTLLRAYGGTVYDEEGNFAVNTPEGVKALEWIREMDQQGITPKGAENMELLDCVNLFYGGQLAICAGNLTNLWDVRNKGIDVFTANFPSMDGNGYCTGSTNGFCVFDNSDKDKIQAAKDFIRFIYADKELMKYALGTLPVNHSVTEEYQEDIWMLKAYSDNIPNTVDNIGRNVGWQNVRDVFYLNIRDLLIGEAPPDQVAAAVDESCNRALKQGREDIWNQQKQKEQEIR